MLRYGQYLCGKRSSFWCRFGLYKSVECLWRSGRIGAIQKACVMDIVRPKSSGSSNKKGERNAKDFTSLVQPVTVNPYNNPDGVSVGEELAGLLDKGDLALLLSQFYQRPEIKRLAAESGLDDRLFHQAYVGFRRFCIDSEQLPPDLHIVLSDILQDAGHVDDIFPYFLQHAKTMFPHLDCMEDLRKISDLRHPPNWYFV